ncbi:terminase small subunit [Thalassobacillus sp. CUG 92003]|uniref:terminase small subunit n=1 Tax=Thalassobacillus sp. CUG 92003 TaxID=2736641 RepID=UPI0015E68E0A|nr:terminase small subunit [Thalassobacillus sp. CUG 92003]
MGKMTEKQKRFCEEYLIDLNATQAAIRARYSKKTARQTANENLTKPYIKEYIDQRLEEIQNEKIADQQEVLQYYTSVLRSEELEEHAFTVTDKEFDEDGGMSMSERIETIKLEPKIRDRNKAAEMIGKRYAMWTDKQQVENITPTFVEDVPDED